MSKLHLFPIRLPAAGLVASAALAALTLSGGPAATQANQMGSAEIERFCSNIAEPARDRRYVLQKQELEALKVEVDLRVKQLEQKRAEYEEWMRARQEFMAQANENVVGIYARMRPDAAAERLASMKAELAAAILLKLQVKQSGQIMNEMDSNAAARLTTIMASASRDKDPT